MEIDVPKFQAKTEVEIKNYGAIKTVLSKLYDAEIELKKKRSEAFLEIKNLKEENSTLRNNVYKKFSESMEALESIKADKISKIKSKLIPTTDEYINEAKRTKQKIGNYKSMKSNELSQERKIEELKKSGADISLSRSALENNKSSRKSLGKSLEDEIMQYEFERIDNNKLIMLHLINYEMAYHARAIETLTQLFKDVKSTKPKASINPLLQSMGVSQQVVDSDDNQEENEEEEDEDNKQKNKSKRKEDNEEEIEKGDDDE
jgi:hypothetical protein